MMAKINVANITDKNTLICDNPLSFAFWSFRGLIWFFSITERSKPHLCQEKYTLHIHYKVSQKKSTFLKFRVHKSIWQLRANETNKIVWNGPTVHNCPNYPNCPIQSLTRVISGPEKVILICRPQISEWYFFLGHPVCKKGGEHLENGEVVGLNWGVTGHLKIMIITITNIICVQLKLTEQMPKLNLLAYLP